MTELRILLFALASAGLVYVSRAALRRPAAVDGRPAAVPHGFYRLGAWEAILALVVLNAPAWFREPLAWRQIISWLLLIAALIPLVLSVRLLARAEHAEAARPDAALFGFEKTTELVTTGVYRYIRHPMYGSLLLLAWGAYFKAPSLPASALVVAATGLLMATAGAEERENVRFFGSAYEAYMRRTKRFIPFLY